MGRPVPISLPNGRQWLKKGDAVEHFKAILARYADGDRVLDATDHDDLSALLKVYDAVVPAGGPTKTGSGVGHFERRPDRDHPGRTSCFFVVRTDGSSIDFSTRRALDVAGARGW
ncbi:DCL family protein [Cupriavidus sp. 30B13]|uniref:DCL family protein n=1 Tax=Cupriavidus sp. 30B13 TaxID=3384241 RepID=UPI003B8ECAFC